MTVIAYSAKHRVLATDSRCSSEDGAILTSCQKLYRLKSGALLGLSGEADDRDVVRLLESATPKKLPTRAQIAELKNNFYGILVFPKGQLFTVESEFYEHSGSHGEWTGQVLPIRDPFVALGCGADFAMGAMEHGASPVEAVRIACRRNSFCALPVQWAKLPTVSDRRSR
jgi:hypothetical protein